MTRPIRFALATCVLGCLAWAATHATAAGAAQTAASQAAMTPAEALRLLSGGNARFAAGTTLRRDLLAQVQETSTGQHPFAAVLGSIDSRVPPELVFDSGLGDLFVARIAGNVLDDELLGSLEFATKEAGARLIVVPGHTRCGAIQGACDGVRMGELTKTLALLAPALEASAGVPGAHDSSNAAYVEHVTQANVRLTAAAMVERSPILASLVSEGRLRVVPAIYDIRSGRVSFLAGWAS